jgi:transcriptional regulator with XRE-family HTH domain
MTLEFGKFLKSLRLDLGVGLRRFAEMVDLEPSNLSAIEHGRRPAPTDIEKLKEIADALGLVEGTENWGTFFDAAKRSGELPADIRHMSNRHLVPTLLRTIDNRQLSDEEIEHLIRDISSGNGVQHDESS